MECFVCGATLRHSHLAGLLQCAGCGFVTADMSLGWNDFKSLYGEDYFHGMEYRDYLAEEVSLRVNFQQRMKTLKKYIPGFSHSRLFEIGCAYGFFLSEASSHVGHAEGIDICAPAVEHSRSALDVKSFCGDYLQHEIENPVDLIVLWDTVEHLGAPRLYLEKAWRDLKIGGHVALTTGDIGSLVARVRKSKWRLIHPPTHLHYFSMRTLRILLESIGFEVIYSGHPGCYRNTSSILHFILMRQSGGERLYKAVSGVMGKGLNLYTNLFDIMFIIAKKR